MGLTKLCLTWRIWQPGQEPPSPIPQDQIPLSSMGFVGPLPLATLMSIPRRDRGCVTLVITPLVEELNNAMSDAACSLRESLDQGILLPLLPRYPKWCLPCTPQSPSLTSSAEILMEHWETSTLVSSPPLSCSLGPPK